MTCATSASVLLSTIPLATNDGFPSKSPPLIPHPQSPPIRPPLSCHAAPPPVNVLVSLVCFHQVIPFHPPSTPHHLPHSHLSHILGDNDTSCISICPTVSSAPTFVFDSKGRGHASSILLPAVIILCSKIHSFTISPPAPLEALV